jgi:hypothetical protein
VIVDASRVATLRARGNSWSQVQAELGVSKDVDLGLEKYRTEQRPHLFGEAWSEVL